MLLAIRNNDLEYTGIRIAISNIQKGDCTGNLLFVLVFS